MLKKFKKKNVQNITYKVKTKNYGKKVVDKVKKGKKILIKIERRGKKERNKVLECSSIRRVKQYKRSDNITI